MELDEACTSSAEVVRRDPLAPNMVSVSFMGGQVLEVPVIDEGITKDLRVAIAAARGVGAQQVRLLKDGVTLMDADEIPADAAVQCIVRPVIPRAPRNWYSNPRYTLSTTIGSGAYSSVCEAVDTQTGQQLAIKRCKNIFDDLTDANRILREIAILRALDHDCVVRLHDAFMPPTNDALHDAGVDLNEVYIVMELCDTDMKKLIRLDVELSLAHVQMLTYNLLRGLKYLDSACVCHRDLKPANCLVNQDCSVKIADFNLSCVVREPEANMTSNMSPRTESTFKARAHRHMTRHVVTRWYRAPEVILLLKYTRNVDVWSTGCIVAELFQLLPGGPLVMDRGPLFPGSACYPLSPRRRYREGRYRDQLDLIFDVLGTPSEAMLARISREDVRSYIQSFGSRTGEGLRSRFEYVDQDSFDFLSKLLRLDPEDRVTIQEALDHPFLASCRDITSETVATKNIVLDFEQANGLNEDYLSRHFVDNIRIIHGGA